MTIPDVDEGEVDIAVVGSGGAGLMAALHAARADPTARVAVVSKGAMGRSGCTLMVQGYNAVLDPADSFELHFRDLVTVGEFLNDQELAWTLVTAAPSTVEELESVVGCYFDRREDGSIDQRPFAGQSFPRKVHRGTETGLEIMARLRDRLFGFELIQLEDFRALDLLRDEEGVAGVVLLDVRRGRPMVLRAPVVIVATGGCTTAYRVASAAREKTGDGLAMCYRAGLQLRDMEMVQFLSVGLLAGESRLTGILLEEALRFAGGRLINAAGERFMERYDPARGERTARDVAVRAIYTEIMEGRGTPEGGVYLDMTDRPPSEIESRFGALVDRARLAGADLSRSRVQIAPAAHFQIGGVVIGPSGETSLPGLLVAGEDAGGVHGAGWTGGNGVAESTIFGARAGDLAVESFRDRPRPRPLVEQERAIIARAFAPLNRDDGPSPFEVTSRLGDAMWNRMGPVRDAEGLRTLEETLAELDEQAATTAVPGSREANFAWQEALDVANQVTVARAMVASALCRRESRGVHHRRDHPARDDHRWLRTVLVSEGDGTPKVATAPVALTRLHPTDAEAG